MEGQQDDLLEIGSDSERLAAFAAMVNSDAFAPIADPFGAIIFSRLLSAQKLGQNVYVKDLTGGLRCSPTSMLRRLEQLEKQGLIRRLNHPEDGRSKLVLITAEGRLCLSRALDQLRSAQFEAATEGHA